MCTKPKAQEGSPLKIALTTITFSAAKLNAALRNLNSESSDSWIGALTLQLKFSKAKSMAKKKSFEQKQTKMIPQLWRLSFRIYN